jgi:hypothetical protein
MDFMDADIFHTVRIGVGIEWVEATRRYNWSYHICMYDGPVTHSDTGNFALERPGRTVIIYTLLEECMGSYQLLHVNLDPGQCATSQIESVRTDHEANSITVVDRNGCGPTGKTPFSLRLVARMKNNINSGFLSPDPQVTNSPNISVQNHRTRNGASTGRPAGEQLAALG